jgi:hypothetical protein
MLTSDISEAHRSRKEFSAKSGMPLGWTLGLPGLSLARSRLEAGNIEPVKVCAIAMTVLGTTGASFNKSEALTCAKSGLPLGWTLGLPGLPLARSRLEAGKVCAVAMTVLCTTSASSNKSEALTSVEASCINTAAKDSREFGDSCESGDSVLDFDEELEKLSDCDQLNEEDGSDQQVSGDESGSSHDSEFVWCRFVW